MKEWYKPTSKSVLKLFSNMSLLYEQCAQFCENLMGLEEKKHQIKTIHQNLEAFSK